MELKLAMTACSSWACKACTGDPPGEAATLASLLADRGKAGAGAGSNCWSILFCKRAMVEYLIVWSRQIEEE